MEGEGVGLVREEEGDEWLDRLIITSQETLRNEFCLKGGSSARTPETVETTTTFKEKFGGAEVHVTVPQDVQDELTGINMDHGQVATAMQLEVQQLERLKVGTCLTESEGRKLAREKKAPILTSRWVITQKTSVLARCRLVVRDFAAGGESAFRAGIYAQHQVLTHFAASLHGVLSWDMLF